MKFKDPWYVYLATGLGIGRLPGLANLPRIGNVTKEKRLPRFAQVPKMPGTWGSLLGIPLAWFIQPLGIQIVILSIAALFILSVYVIAKTEAYWGRHDAPQIVIDEVLGQFIGLVFLPPNLALYLLGFIIFRVLDIRKPFFIGWLDRKLPGAWGTLLDDVAAGVVTALLLILMPV